MNLVLDASIPSCVGVLLHNPIARKAKISRIHVHFDPFVVLSVDVSDRIIVIVAVVLVEVSVAREEFVVLVALSLGRRGCDE